MQPTNYEKKSLEVFLGMASNYPGAWQNDAERQRLLDAASCTFLMIPTLDTPTKPPGSEWLRLQWDLAIDGSACVQLYFRDRTVYVLDLEQSKGQLEDSKRLMVDYYSDAVVPVVIDYSAIQTASLMLVGLTALELVTADGNHLSPAYTSTGRLEGDAVVMTLCYSNSEEKWQALLAKVVKDEEAAWTEQAMSTAINRSLFNAGMQAIAQMTRREHE